LRDERGKLLRDVKLPPGTDPRVLEDALGWSGWTTTQRTDLVRRYQDATTAAVANWPMAPSRQELSAPPKQSERVFAGSLRDLRNRVDLVRVWNPEVAGKFRAEIGGNRQPSMVRFSALAVEVFAEVRTGPRKRGDQDERTRPLVGWALNTDDLPAVPPTDPARNPEPTAFRRDTARFVAWYAGRQTQTSTEVSGFAPIAAARYTAVAAEVTK
jgi:hypothetical protein